MMKGAKVSVQIGKLCNPVRPIPCANSSQASSDSSSPITLQLRTSDTIGNVKTRIQLERGIHPQKQTLHYEDTALDNASKLSEYIIQNSSIIRLSVDESLDMSKKRKSHRGTSKQQSQPKRLEKRARIAREEAISAALDKGLSETEAINRIDGVKDSEDGDFDVSEDDNDNGEVPLETEDTQLNTLVNEPFRFNCGALRIILIEKYLQMPKNVGRLRNRLTRLRMAAKSSVHYSVTQDCALIPLAKSRISVKVGPCIISQCTSTFILSKGQPHRPGHYFNRSFGFWDTILKNYNRAGQLINAEGLNSIIDYGNVIALTLWIISKYL